MKNKQNKNKLLLPALSRGSKIGLVTPAGPVSQEQVAIGLQVLTSYGFNYQFGKYAFSDNGIVAAEVEQRLEDLHGFLEDDSIKAIWALRGGYGSIQLLKRLNYSHWMEHPKLFVGFSDLTALQWALFSQTGIPSISGFTLTTQVHPENPFLLTGLEILAGERTILDETVVGKEVKIVQGGRARGTFIGGTLSMICSLCGTPYWPEGEEWIVFIEDVNEPLYRIDRFFQQLALCGFWERVNGVILGKFFNNEDLLNVSSLLLPLLKKNIPVVENFPYGHYENSCPLPMGVTATLHTEPFSLQWQPFLQHASTLS